MLKTILLPGLLLICLMLILNVSIGQSVSINNDASLPSPQAILDIKSTTQGILIPRMLSSERILIQTPPQGLLVYQTDAPEGIYYQAAITGFVNWKRMIPADGQYWTNSLSGNHIVNSNSGNVGIGNSFPNLAGLVADRKVGNVNAMFGTNIPGISIESNAPGIGFNSYFNSSRKAMANGYGGFIGLDPATGDFTVQTSSAAGTAGSVLTVNTRMLINNTGNVGIGVATPVSKLDVTSSAEIYTGFFNNTGASVNNFGLYGASNTTPYYGTGVKGVGGFIGVEASANLAGTGVRYGIKGSGSNGATSNYGVWGEAAGGTTAYGLHGSATGASTNWAGYFTSGNVYLQNNLGVGSTSPTLAKVQVEGAMGNTVAMFSQTAASRGISLVSDDPGVYFNSYYNAGAKQMSATGYASIINTDQTSGALTFFTSPIANTAAGATSTAVERMRLNKLGYLGIGTTNPLYPLDATGSVSRTGNFINTAVSTDNYGVYGSTNNTPYYGYGVYGVGGYRGVDGEATLAGTGDRYGVYGKGSNGTSANYGMYGTASGGTVSYGVYSAATGATTNWAAYFAGGNVFVQNKMGVGVTDPASAVDVSSNLYIAGNFLNTSSNTGVGVHAKCVVGPDYGTGVWAEGVQSGVLAQAVIAGPADHSGVLSYGSNSTGKNYGVEGHGSGGTTAVGIYGFGSGGTKSYGVYGKATTFTGRGGYFINEDLGGEGVGVEAHGGLVGIDAYSTKTGAPGARHAVYATASGGLSNFGIYSSASGSGASYAYAVYAEIVSPAPTSYAGYFAGNVYTTGAYLPSDRTLKKNIQPLTEAMSIINQLRPSVYNYNTEAYKQMQLPEGKRYGLIADEVQDVLPGLVKKTVQPESYENNDGVRGKKIAESVEFNAVNYSEIIPILVGAVKEQSKLISELKERIEVLEKGK